MSRRRGALLAVVAVLVLLFGGRWVALRYTEHAWFDDLGQASRFNALFLRAILWQLAVFLTALSWYAAHTLGVYRSIGSVHLPRRLGNLDIDEAVPPRILRGIALAVAALLAAATAYTFNDIGDYVALARFAEPIGRPDVILQQDASYYVATLPLLEVLHLLASISVLLATALVVGLYALTGSFTMSRRRVRITPHARTHLVVMLCALALVLAWGFHLDTFQVVAGGGHHEGALTGVDQKIRIPASTALALIALVVAAGSALATRWVRPALLVSLWVTLGVAALLGRVVVPVLADAWGAASHPAIQQNLSQLNDGFSRASFGLLSGDFQARTITAGEVHPESAAAVEEAIRSINAWSGELTVPARLLDEAEGDTLHLRAWTISPAVSTESGRPRPALLAVPQTDMISVSRMTARPRWEKLHRDSLAWGGDPIAIDASLRAGPMRYLVSLDPAETTASHTHVRRAPGRLRFLPGGIELGVAGPDENTFGEPAPGVLLGGFPRRLLLAWALQSPPLLDDHTSDADRIIFWRDLPSRLARLYPFAAFDPPYAAMVGARLTWIVDGYLMSSRFPLAEHVRWHQEEINYLAAPYVVVVDAITGRTRFFLRPGADAFALSVARASLLEPLPSDSIEPALRARLRYPAGLLAAQAMMLAKRGAGGPRSPRWSLTWSDTTLAQRDAAYIAPTLAILPLEPPRERSWQIIPLSDSSGSRLEALVAGTVSENGAPRLRLFRPEGPASITPTAASVRIAATPAVMAAVAAAGPGGTPHRGRVFVVPAGGSIIYGEALYTGSEHSSEAPKLTAVVLLAAGRIGIGADAHAAVHSLLHGEGEISGSLTTVADMAQAQAAFLALDSARQAGDWVRFGRAWASLRRALHLEPAPPPRP